MKRTKSYNVQIWVGLKESFGEGAIHIHTLNEVLEICDLFVNEVSDCVSVTQTSFRYKGNSEPGVVVGYISYPRFPKDPDVILARAITLGTKLMEGLNQYKVTITTPDESIMLENDFIKR
jgi:hypothetical protein